jgi:catechol 2,3-dioxygenase-like lactoylglutathione lyase family enzyme
MNPIFDGAHLIIESADATADRAFIREVLGFDNVDAGDGWLLFALPPAELAVHPGDNGRHQLYLMCPDVDAASEGLRSKGVTVSDVSEQSWGRLASLTLPGGGQLWLYQPKHPRAAG